ncbi:hypothetical protein BJ165DRAFT_1515121 [Panaeolus papilionaceus]|nr:hypothetical protein BJ165DRAFT_1515121 [Panaeolus papilionaceus]
MCEHRQYLDLPASGSSSQATSQTSTPKSTNSQLPDKKSKRRPKPPRVPVPEEHLLLPEPPSHLPIIDTHTHIAATFDFYKRHYKDGKYKTVYEFAKGLYDGRNVKAIVDVWCEAPISKKWKEYADAALDPSNPWNGIEYWFAIGIHPHDSRKYNDKVEREMTEALKHPRCVSLGEIGLDYHYDQSPQEKQRAVFIRQLRLAVKLGKPLTLHTREADEDTERILKEEVPRDHKIHVHCFSDSPEFAQRLLEHFPNLYIGITGIITYSSNVNTATAIRNVVQSWRATLPKILEPGPLPLNEDHLPDSNPPLSVDNSINQDQETPIEDPPKPIVYESLPPLRILLETDAPFMTPSNLYDDIKALKRGHKLPLSHSAMIPWTAKFVADVAGDGWDADVVMRESLENTRHMYGI